MSLVKPVVQSSATGCPSYTETLPCHAVSAARARRLVAAALTAWRLDNLVDTGVLVVTEFIANSAQHTPCRFVRVTVTRSTSDTVRIAVTDKSTELPVRRCAGGLEEQGRDLALVAAVSQETGTDTFRWGKRQWAQIGANAASRRDPAQEQETAHGVRLR